VTVGAGAVVDEVVGVVGEVVGAGESGDPHPLAISPATARIATSERTEVRCSVK
jgi:hypothetical protein